SISLSRLAPCRSTIKCTPAQRTPLRTAKWSLHVNSRGLSVAAEAATFSLVLRSSLRAVLGTPKLFTDRKRAFWLMPSSPIRDPRCRHRGKRKPLDQSTRTDQQRLNPHINAISGVSRRFCNESFNVWSSRLLHRDVK